MPQTLFWNLLAKKLSKQATPHELDMLNELMKQHPEWLHSVEHLIDVWELEGNKTEDTALAMQAFEQHAQRLDNLGIGFSESEINSVKPVRNEWVKKSLVVTAFVAVFLVLLTQVFPSFNKTDKPVAAVKNKVFSNTVSKSKIVLPDSTVVWLNKGSSLTYNSSFGKQTRSVSLQGEAFFDVRHGAIPFLISTHSVVIKVLGTAFNVRSYKNESTTETSLIRGKVQITINGRPGEQLFLKPNEKLVIKNEKGSKKTNTSVLQKEPLIVLSKLTQLTDSTVLETTWKEETLVFTDESFEELAQKMQRWYGVSITIENNGLKKERFTGTFKNETPEQALTALQLTASFQFKKHNTGFRVTK